MSRIATYKGKLLAIKERPWVRRTASILSILGVYDLLAAQILPEALANRLPKAREFVAMTSGWLPWYAWLIIGLFVIIFALLEQHYKTARASSSPTIEIDQGRPNLQLLLHGGNVFVPDLRADLVGVALDATVWNTALPSAAVEWGLRVISAAGEEARGHPAAIPEEMKLNGPPTVTLRRSDSLAEKTMATPIGTVPVRGILLFYVKMSKTHIVSGKIEVSATDIYGHQSTAVRDLKEWLQSA